MKNARMAEERAQIVAESEQVRAEAWRLNLDKNAFNVVLRRRHQTHMPLHYDAMNLFNTPGAGPSTRGGRAGPEVVRRLSPGSLN